MKKRKKVNIYLDFEGQDFEELENARHKLRALNYTETVRTLIQKGLEAIS